jgi:hypothetical protein
MPKNIIWDLGVIIRKFEELLRKRDIEKTDNPLILLVKKSFLGYTLPLTTVGHSRGKAK